MGFSYYYGDNNYDAALKEFEIAQRGLPNEAEVYLAPRRDPAPPGQMGGIDCEP